MKIENCKLKIENWKKGVSLYLALMIMSVLLALALGISAILYGQQRVMEGMGDSVIAFYAANTGIERELDEGNPPGTSYSGYLDLNGNGVQDEADSAYNVTVTAGGGDSCPSGMSFCIKSVGVFKQIRRAIRIAR